MGQIIDFNLKKGNLTNISLFAISRDNIFKGIVTGIISKKVNSYNDLDNYKFVKIEEMFNNTIKDYKFKDRVISILGLIRNYSDKKYLKVNDKNVIGFLNGKDYLFLSMKDKNIEYAIEKEEEASYGKIRFYKDKYVINYNDINKSYLYNISDRSKKMTIINSSDTTMYDSLGYVLASKNKTMTSNYDMFTLNDAEYSVPDKYNNVTTSKITRVGSNVLKNVKVEYLNKEYKNVNGNYIIDSDTIDEDNYYVGFNYNTNSKTIPSDIYYQDIDYEDYTNMKRGR